MRGSKGGRAGYQADLRCLRGRSRRVLAGPLAAGAWDRGLCDPPDESGKKRREQGLAKAGNGRIRRALIQLAWRLLRHQPQSGLVQWYRARTADGRRDTRKVMIVALARKLLVALWELVTTGKVPEGMKLHPAPVAG